MINKDNMYEGLYFALEGSVRNKIDTQVILQLLVKKGLVTSTEVAKMREYVSSQTMYSSMLNSLNEIEKEVNVTNEYKMMFSKVLDGDATQEERNKLLSLMKRGN